MTKNRQKTEPERTIYKVNNTIPRVQVKMTLDNHQITQDIHFLYKRLSMYVPNTIFQTADNNIYYTGRITFRLYHSISNQGHTYPQKAT